MNAETQGDAPEAPGEVVYEPYGSAYEAVEDAKILVKLWLQRHLLLYGPRYQKRDGYSDLYVGRDEVEAFLAGRLGDGQAANGAENVAAVDEMEATYRHYLRQRVDRTAEAGLAEVNPLPMEAFRAAFGVTDERLMDIVIALLMVEVDPEYLRAYAHAWADFTQKQVELGFLIELVSRSPDDRDRLSRLFLSRDHPIFAYQALELATPDGASARRGLMQRALWLPERVVQFLAGETRVPVQITGTRGGLREAPRGLDAVLLPEATQRDVRQAAAALFDEADAGAGTRTLYLYGPEGGGKRSVCEGLAAELGRPLLLGDSDQLSRDPVRFGDRLVSFLREARLQRAVPALIGADGLAPVRQAGGAGAEPEARLNLLQQVTTMLPGALLMTGIQRVPDIRGWLPEIVELTVPHPTRDAQREIWGRVLPKNTIFEGSFSVEDIVMRYSLTGGAIERVAAQVLQRTRERGGPPHLTAGRVLPAIRDQLHHRLGSLAVPVARGFGWDDLVIEDKTREALEEIVSYVRNREQIAETWGFGAKMAYGRGVAALFHGAPGTGKTMAASIIGTDLAMEVFQIDLSRIVDKYIGETEKNLAKVFDEGARAQAVLLFDEADSLFGKRTQVRSATDRYANLEVNFLLQMIEAYEGISILTSNFQESIDDAFKRRIRFKVEFPFPKKEERLQLWQVMIPEEAPLGYDVDFDELAERFELTGAHIKNVVLRCASMAADGDGIMSRAKFVEAANREYLELGKIVREDEEGGA